MGTFYFIIVFIAVLALDKRMYKIRAFDRFENGSLKTYRFLDNGERKDSRKLHSRESVVGVVEYKL